MERDQQRDRGREAETTSIVREQAREARDAFVRRRNRTAPTHATRDAPRHLVDVPSRIDDDGQSRHAVTEPQQILRNGQIHDREAAVERRRGALRRIEHRAHDERDRPGRRAHADAIVHPQAVRPHECPSERHRVRRGQE